jgi:hypothetical protein
MVADTRAGLAGSADPSVMPADLSTIAKTPRWPLMRRDLTAARRLLPGPTGERFWDQFGTQIGRPDRSRQTAKPAVGRGLQCQRRGGATTYARAHRHTRCSYSPWRCGHRSQAGGWRMSPRGHESKRAPRARLLPISVIGSVSRGFGAQQLSRRACDVLEIDASPSQQLLTGARSGHFADRQMGERELPRSAREQSVDHRRA